MTSYSLITSDGRAKFARQLYNLWDMLEREGETEDLNAFDKLQNTINNHDEKFPMKTFFSTKDAPGAGGGAGGIRATDCAELRAHGYEVKPEAVAIADESGEHEMELLSRVRQPLPTHTLR